jgi:hypothetical protein
VSERNGTTPPDRVVFAALIAESVLMGHEEPDDGIAWAVREGYIALLPDLSDDRNVRILDAGRAHVAERAVKVNRG